MKIYSEIIKKLKARLLGTSIFRKILGAFRRWQLHHDYESRREYYARWAQEKGIVYREGEVITAIRDRLRARRYQPTPRRIGNIHTFAFVPDLGWHRHLLPDLRELGPVSVFDYVSQRFSLEEFWRLNQAGIARRRAMN